MKLRFFEVSVENCGAYDGGEGEEDELDRDDHLQQVSD
jgi:hypothetical protein